jgi:hypothetical protein
MSAAAAQATVPLYQEGKRFWQELFDECKRHVQAINSAAVARGISLESLVQFQPGAEIHLVKSGYPTTNVKALLSFFAWGPVIQCTIAGARDADHRLLTCEFEMPVARDLDGKTVAVFDEGRSFSPSEVASYLTQAFRGCFRNIPLPCGAREESPQTA